MIQNEVRVADHRHAFHHLARISELHQGHLTSKGPLRYESYELAGKFLNHAVKIWYMDIQDLFAMNHYVFTSLFSFTFLIKMMNQTIAVVRLLNHHLPAILKMVKSIRISGQQDQVCVSLPQIYI